MNTSKAELSDFSAYFKKEKISFPSLMEKVSDNEIKRKQLNAENGFCSTHLIEHENKKFVVKNDREMDNRFEKGALDFISGSFYSYMTKRLARLAPE